MTNSQSRDDPRHPIDADLERYRIRYGFFKVIVGTTIVGLAGILVPGAVEYWQTHFENRRKTLELQLEQSRQQQFYIKDFLTTALDQDIELRIRFADYFANVSPERYISGWQNYRKSLIEQRNNTRKLIHDNEHLIRQALAEENPPVETQIKIAQLERDLEWRYREVGYVPKGRSVVPSVAEQQDADILQSSGSTPRGSQIIHYIRYIRESLPAIIAEARASGVTNLAQIAYILATSEYESGAGKFMTELWGPTAAQIRYEGLADLGNTQPGDGFRYRGRGFVQILGRKNYELWSGRLGIDLLNEPEIVARDASIAAKILVQGMRDGVFTGKALNHYINDEAMDFYDARKIINSANKDEVKRAIADSARDYLRALREGVISTNAIVEHP